MARDARPTRRGSQRTGQRNAARQRWGASATLVLVVALLAFVGGAFAGRLLFGNVLDRLLGVVAQPKVSLSESQLDDVVASYTLGGRTYTVSYRDALLENGSLEAARNADGTYRVPSADSVLATARGRVLVAEAERLGITVNETQVNAYAEATYGTTSVSSIAQTYGMEEEAAAVLLKEAATMSCLRDEAMKSEAGEAPAPPAEPKAGEEVTMTPEYGAYVTALAGDEWDGEAQAWVSADGPFASALSDYEISSAGASYEAARQAYYVAYQQHVARQSAYAAEWTDYVNSLLGASSIAISTLAV